MKTLRLCGAFVRVDLVLIRRNPLELVGAVVISIAVVLSLFFGIRLFAPSVASSAQSRGAILAGLLVLLPASAAYQEVVNQVQTSSTNGTLEQLAMSPLGLWRVLVANFTAAMLQVLAIAVVAILIVSSAIRDSSNLDFLSVIPLFALILATVLGLGLLLGGATLLYKRMQILTGIVVIPLLALVTIPVEQSWLLKLLPISLPSSLIRQAWTDHRNLLQLPLGDLLLAVVMTAFYFTGGALVFRFMDRKARERGVLGSY